MIFFGVNDGVPGPEFVFAGKSQGVVQLSLSGGNFNCKNRKFSSVGATKNKPIRRLWGTGKGKFTTKGKYASATVRGTDGSLPTSARARA